jgi:hypothetical protein
MEDNFDLYLQFNYMQFLAVAASYRPDRQQQPSLPTLW